MPNLGLIKWCMGPVWLHLRPSGYFWHPIHLLISNRNEMKLKWEIRIRIRPLLKQKESKSKYFYTRIGILLILLIITNNNNNNHHQHHHRRWRSAMAMTRRRHAATICSFDEQRFDATTNDDLLRWRHQWRAICDDWQ